MARNNRIVEKTLVIASERALALKEWALGEGQSPHNIKLRLPFIVGLRRGGKFETGTSMTLSQLLWFAEKQFPLELVCLRSVMGDASETLEYEYFISDCMSKGIFPRGSTDDFTPVRTKLKTNTWTVLATE
ncbi:MAG TPA: hypothetical protein QGF02_02905 [Candidatus Babeliales bacterium]|nr:hypothetical protein [Candidatus Babeliales bacterium]